MENSQTAFSSNWVANIMSAYAPRVGEYRPDQMGPVPIGNIGSEVSNFRGNKFSRGWLDGAGGQDIENALGSTAFALRPTPLNQGTYYAALRSVGPNAPVPGLSNTDVNTPGRTWNPLAEARAEWIPASTSDLRTTQDLVSGSIGPTIATAANSMLKSPTPQFYWYGQMREGGEAYPSYPSTPAPSTKARAAGVRASRGGV